MALSEDQLEAAINRLVDAFNSATGRVSGASSTASTALSRLATDSRLVESGFRALTRTSATVKNVDEARYNVGLLLVKNLKDLVSSSIDATRSLYGVGSGLASFTRTLEGVERGFDSAVTFASLGLASTLNPAAVGAAVALKSVANVVGGAFFGAMKLQLGLMEQQLSAYKSVNEAGAIFGGSLSRMQVAAQSTGTGLQILSKIIIDNAENIGKLGLSMSLGGATVAQYASHIARTDRAMLNLYGSTEELSKGVSDYLVLQAQLGRTDLNNQQAQTAGLREYLRTTKELSDITGKRASQLKAEEEARRRELAYALKLSRLGDDAKRNVTEGMAVATKLFGDAGARYAQEYFATGGKVYSKEALRFQAMMPEAANAIAEMVTATDESKDQYRKRVGEYLDANKEALIKSAKQLEDFAEINYGANNPILTAMTQTGSEILRNANLISNYNDLLKKATDESNQADKGKIVKDGKAVEDKTGQVIQDAEKARLDNQLKIDKMVSENFSKFNLLIDALYKVQQMQIATTGKIVDGLGTFLKWLDDNVVNRRPSPRENPNTPPMSSELPLVDSNGSQIPTKAVPVRVVNPEFRNQQDKTPASPAVSGTKPSASPANPITPPVNAPANPPANADKTINQPAIQPTNQTTNPPTRALGGLANGPTLVGEDGPEAVIPLAKGAIPMNIDWKPLIMAMERQGMLTEDLIKAVNDSKDIQRQMLHSL